MEIEAARRLIVKVGSRLLIDEERGQFNTPWLASLVDDLTRLVRQGVKVLIVTSGSVACGNLALGLSRCRMTLEQQQAAAAVGQIQLMQTYQTLFAQQGFKAAQILLTMSDIETRRRYVNLRNTIESLFKMDVVPIINENDCIATDEIRYGDNDRLSARVAQMIEADTLVLLSDIDGLYTKNPKIDKQAEFIHEVKHITPEIVAMAGDSNTNYGSGGMITKIQAAKIATQSGCHLLIISGNERSPLANYKKNKRGTWFLAQTSQLSAKKAWLREHLKPLGHLTIDQGAAKALTEGKSLLPVGISAVDGRFAKGDPVSIVSEEREELARGLINYSDEEVKKIKGKSTDELFKLLGYAGSHEVVHRNNLVLIR